MKITDKSQKYGLKTKNIIIRGYPAVVFCTAGLKIDEQEATRFMLLSPETTQGKIKQGINEAIKQAADTEHYLARLNNDPARNLLIDRIKAIKDARINDIRINDSEKIEAWFFQNHTVLKPRHQRDIKRIISLIKVIALLNLWHRETVSPGIILTADQDIESGLRIWEDISFSQELNIPPYIYRLFQEVFVVLYQEKQAGLSRKDLLHGHLKIYGRPLPEWQLRREIIPMLEMAGLIIEEMDPDDKRSRLITPICPTTESTISDKNIM